MPLQSSQFPPLFVTHFFSSSAATNEPVAPELEASHFLSLPQMVNRI